MNLLTTLARRLFSVIEQLREPIGQYQQRHHAVIPLLNLAWARMRRMIIRLERLTLRWERDRLTPPAPRAKRPATPRKAPELRLPTAHGWLLKLVPLTHMGAGALHFMFQDPDCDARALVAAAPQAGRILRPLCRMLGIDQPDWLRLPRRPRKPRAPKPPKPPRLRQHPRRGLSRLSGAELYARLAPLPPHFPLPIPGYRTIRRKIAEYEASLSAPPIVPK